MNASRLAAWIFGLGVCTAWLSSAAGVGRNAPPPRTIPKSPINAELSTLAADVQTQASRLRDRLAEAPAPSSQERNPFSFVARSASPPRVAVRSVGPAPAIVTEPQVAEPILTLIGVAEMAGPSGPVRTAMITGPAGDLLMVQAGQTLLGRYEVTAIGADAVQLKQTDSGAVRTLVLR
jgi:hypothetical protein